MLPSLMCPEPGLHLRSIISTVFVREWKVRHDSATSPDYKKKFSIHFSNTMALNWVSPSTQKENFIVL